MERPEGMAPLPFDFREVVEHERLTGMSEGYYLKDDRYEAGQTLLRAWILRDITRGTHEQKT